MKRQPPFDPALSAPINGLWNADPDAPYVNGNPSTGQEGSIPPAEVWDHPQREIVEVIEQAGIEPDHTDLTQLWQALQWLVGERLVESVGGGAVSIYQGIGDDKHQIRTLEAGSNVTLALVENPPSSGKYKIRISATGGGGGGGGDPVTVAVPASTGWAGIPLAYTSATSVTVKPGECWADNGVDVIKLPSGVLLDLTGTGAGKLDTGALANSTWYDVWAIKKSADGTVSAIATAASSPTMPSGYDRKRYLGSFRTNGSAQVIPFDQYGHYVKWRTKISDRYWNPAGGAASATVTTSVPIRRSVVGHYGVALVAAYYGIVTVRLDSIDQGAGPGAADYEPALATRNGLSVSAVGYGGGANYGEFMLPTNDLAQVKAYEWQGYMLGTVPDVRAAIATVGWFYAL